MPRIIETSKEEYKEEAKKKIVKAAVNVVRRKGFQSMTVEDIAKEVGVTKAALYLYFENKEDLFNSVMTEGARLFEEVIECSYGDTDDLDTALENMINQTMNLQKTFGPIEDNLVLVVELFSIVLRDPEKYSMFWGVFQKNITVLENGLRALQKKKLIKKGLDLHDAAMGVLALMGAVKIRIYLGEDEDPVKKWWVSSVKKLLEVT
jgi:AcrR family transcriptional regulator